MFLSYSSSIWLLFVLLLDFLFQLFICFFVSCFRWNHCFLTLFICLYSVVLCCSFLFLFFVCVVTSWFLVFCIFIYSCNYILVFFSISSSFFCITALSDVVISHYFPHKLLFSSCYIFVLFVAMFSFAFLLSLVLFASFTLDVFIFVCGYRITF